MEFTTEQQIRDFFGDHVFKFICCVDGVADYESVVPFEHDGYLADYRISLFIEDRNFLAYDRLNEVLGDLKIFQLFRIDGDNKEELFFKPYEYA